MTARQIVTGIGTHENYISILFVSRRREQFEINKIYNFVFPDAWLMQGLLKQG